MLTIFTISVGSVLVAGICMLIGVIESLYPEPRPSPPAAPAPEPPAASARRITRSSDLPACGSFW